MEKKIAASFRDPCGVVFSHKGKIFRQINHQCSADYELLIASKLYEKLARNKYLIPHQEVNESPIEPRSAYKIIQPERVEFISYPYEWAFSQLKDAALLTLSIQKEALKMGMTLKDASAYNIQFHRGAPLLIDTLSLTKYIEGTPWVAYRQFCQHFLGPLALMSGVDIRLNKLFVNYIDGIPLDLCSRLLPFSSRLNFGLLTHIHVHSQAQSHYAKTTGPQVKGSSAKQMSVTRNGLIGLIDSLENTINKLSIKISGHQWADYYSETNYSEDAFEAKKELVFEMVRKLDPHLILDLGANTGVFSQLVATIPESYVISTDFDPEAVELNYQHIKKSAIGNILPLIIDLTNPSPAIGWENQERPAFYERAQVDVVLALALLHHLAIANNLPFEDIARSMARLGMYLLLEFVPKEDSQVKRLLQYRDDIFVNYHLDALLAAFEPFYHLEDQVPVPGSLRSLLLFKRK